MCRYGHHHAENQRKNRKTGQKTADDQQRTSHLDQNYHHQRHRRTPTYRVRKTLTQSRKMLQLRNSMRQHHPSRQQSQQKQSKIDIALRQQKTKQSVFTRFHFPYPVNRHSHPRFYLSIQSCSNSHLAKNMPHTDKKIAKN